MANPYSYAGCAYGQPQFGGTMPQAAAIPASINIMTFKDVRIVQASDQRLLAASSSPSFSATPDKKVFS